jgi:hypothetical protein
MTNPYLERRDLHAVRSKRDALYAVHGATRAPSASSAQDTRGGDPARDPRPN